MTQANGSSVVNHTDANPWWKQKQKKSSGFVAQTPDPTRYHPLDDVQRGRLGMMGTMIPRARADGTSRAFDHSKAGVLIVNDPERGQIVIDPKDLTPARVRAAIEAVGGEIGHGRETDDQQVAVYRQLGRPIGEVPEQERIPEYLRDAKPRQMSTPAPQPPLQVKQAEDEQSAVAQRPQSGGFVTPRLQPTPVQPAVVLSPPLPLPAATVQPPAAAGVVLTPELLAALLNQARPALLPDAPVSPPPPEPIEPTGITFLDSRPRKPTETVVFDLGDAGTMRSRYHAAVQGAGCLVLIYDTRWDDGGQWVPPDRGAEGAKTPLKVTLPNQDNKQLRVCTLGLHFSLGCLDCVVLPYDLRPELDPPGPAGPSGPGFGQGPAGPDSLPHVIDPFGPQ